VERRIKRAAAVAALLLGLGGAAAAQEGTMGKGGGIRVALLAGGYWPTRGDASDFFGDVWPNLDLELFWQEPDGKEGFTVDVSYRAGDDDGEVTLIPFTFGWWMELEDWGQEDDPSRGKKWRSYAAARVGPYYGKVSGILGGESTVGLNGHLMLGALFGRSFLMELRYDWYTKIADTYFDGVTFQIGFLLN
jgi:hypothetical protein